MWFERNRKRRRELAKRAAHRETAANCVYFTGDRYLVDWGTCKLCP